jgi:hypothetical protein
MRSTILPAPGGVRPKNNGNVMNSSPAHAAPNPNQCVGWKGGGARRTHPVRAHAAEGAGEERLLGTRAGSRHGFVEHVFVALEPHRQHGGGGELTDDWR